MNKKTNEKTIYEMETVELKSAKSTLNDEISTLQSEINNYSVSVVIGVPMDRNIKVNDKNMTVNDFMETETFENAVSDIVDNYGTVCSALFAKKGKIDNEIVKNFCKNLKISKQVFWKTIWKKAKIITKENKIEKIDKQITYLSEREGEKIEDSE